MRSQQWSVTVFTLTMMPQFPMLLLCILKSYLPNERRGSFVITPIVIHPYL